MTDDECALAMTAFKSAYQYTPMDNLQARQFKRLFIGHKVETVRGVIDDLISRGLPRPGPAEMGEMLRSKSGASAWGHRVHRDGPYLEDVAPEPSAPDEFTAQMARLKALAVKQ